MIEVIKDPKELQKAMDEAKIPLICGHFIKSNGLDTRRLKFFKRMEGGNKYCNPPEGMDPE